MGTASESESNANGWGRAGGLMVKTVVLIGSAVLLKRLTKSETRWDHARIVADSLTGEKVLLIILLLFVFFIFLNLIIIGFDFGIVFDGTGFQGS